MAITARFDADFSTFQTAVQQAEVTLKSFDAGAQTVEKSLTRMVDNFSGRKLIQDVTLMVEAIERTGGVATLTAKELQTVGAKAEEAADKLRALGQDVPPKIQEIVDATKKAGTGLSSVKSIALEVAGALGIVFSVQAVIQWGKAMVDAVVQGAGALVDLEAKTGASVEQLQRFAFVGKQANVSVEDFAQSSFKLGVALAGGSGSVRKAVEDLGLSYDKLRSQSPDEQFNDTIKALEKMIDPTERNRIGVELFGKSFATIAQAVAKGYSDMAAQATVSSKAQIKAIDDASDAWDRWVAKQKTGVTSALGDVILLRNAVAQLGEGYAKFLIDTDKTITSIEDLDRALIRTAAAADLNLPSMKRTTDTTKDYVAELAKASAEVDKLSVADRAGIDAALKLGAAHDEIAVAFHLSNAALAVYSERTREFIERQKALTEATRNQIAAESERRTLQEAINKIVLEQTDKVNKQVIGGFEAITKARKDLFNFEQEQVLSATDFEILKIWEVAGEQIKAFKGTEEQRKQFNTAILTLASEQADALYATEAELAEKTAAKFNEVTEQVNQSTVAARELVGVLSGEVASALGGFAASLDKLALTPGSSLGFGHGQMVQSTITLPARAGGGPVSAGQPYMVGEHGPEMFTPGSSGWITPNGGGPTVIQLVVDGRVLSEIVATDLMRRSGLKIGAA